MGAVQRLATVVVIGLVALSTILVLYLADESNRIDAEEQEQQEAAIERGMTTFTTYCVACHGPAGEGFLGPDAQNTGRIGAPLGGDTPATHWNQEGFNPAGTPVPLDVRAETLRETIVNGKGEPPRQMPAWGEELNDEQIDELVVMIQHVDWDRVYNHVIEESGGYPTPPPPPASEDEEPAEEGEEEGGESGGGEVAATVNMVDIDFDPKEIEIPAGTDAQVALHNTGNSVHDFTIEALGIHEVLQPGDSKTITINAEAGEYDYICTQPGHKEAGMVGILHVTEGGGAAASPVGGEAAAEGAGGQAAGGEQAQGDATAAQVEMVDIDFDPKVLEIAASTDVTVHLTNTGSTVHDFTIEDLDIHEVLDPGESMDVTINAPAGEYQYICTQPGHKEAGMVGTLTAT